MANKKMSPLTSGISKRKIENVNQPSHLTGKSATKKQKSADFGTGEACLPQDEKVLCLALQKTLIKVINSAPTDSTAAAAATTTKTVVSIDRSQVTQPGAVGDRESVLRDLFRLVSEQTQESSSQAKKSLSVVYIMPAFVATSHDSTVLQTVVDVMNQASAMLNIDKFHVICSVKANHKLSYVNTILPKVMAMVNSKSWKAVTHVEATEAGISKLLTSLGYAKSDLPFQTSEQKPSCATASSVVTATATAHVKAESKQKVKSDMSPLELLSHVSENADGDVTTSKAGKKKKEKKDVSSIEDEMPPYGEDSEELTDAQKEYYRKRNAMYSKRNYYKKKNEFKDLQNWSFEMQAKNHDLKEEGKRLEALVAMANKMAARHEAGSKLPSLHAQFPAMPPSLSPPFAGPVASRAVPVAAKAWSSPKNFASAVATAQQHPLLPNNGLSSQNTAFLSQQSAANGLYMLPSPGNMAMAQPTPEEMDDLALLRYIRRKREISAARMAIHQQQQHQQQQHYLQQQSAHFGLGNTAASLPFNMSPASSQGPNSATMNMNNNNNLMLSMGALQQQRQMQMQLLAHQRSRMGLDRGISGNNAMGNNGSGGPKKF